MLDVEGRVIIVTGAARGMGASHVRALAQRGACVVVNDLGGNLYQGYLFARPGRGFPQPVY